MNNRGTQNDIISQYVQSIDNYEEKSANLQSFNKKGKRGHQSASRQILDLDGDFDEETSEYARSVMEGTSKSTPVKPHTAPWDTPVSPMDEIFRQTVGALGSNKKLPFIPDSDMNDSSTNASDENPSTPTFSNLKQSEMDIYRGLDDSDYESNSLNLHEDTEFVDSYQEAEKKIFGIQPSHSSSEDSVSDAPDSSLRPQIDTEESYADEDYISISDLPPDFGIPSEDTKTSHHLYNGVYHNEPPLSEEDLESLEKQMEQLNNSQSSRLFSQPSIAEIIVGEADNLVVLPRGESPVSSPEARLMSNSRKVDFFSEGSPKYTNNVPDTSSESEDESENQETLSDHISEPATNLADNIQIDTLLSEDTDEIISNRQNWMYSGNNPHIPPSPFIDEGFKNQIPYPKLMSPSSNIDFQAISRRRSKEKPEENDDESEPEEEEEEQEEEEEEIEPRKLDQSLLIPSPQRPHNSQVSLSAGNSRNKENFYEEESSSEEGEEDDKVHGYPTHSGTQESSNKTMTSDDEREEDQRLFDAIMNEKPKKIITNTIPVPLTVSSEIPPPAPTEEEIQEYYAEMMRCALKGFNPSNIDNIPMKSYDDIPNHSSSSSGDDDDPNRSLQEISTNAIQNMDQHFHEIFSRHNLTSTLAEEILDEIELKEYNYHQKKQRKNKKKDVNIIQKMELEMPCTSTSSVMSPDEYYKESTPSSVPSTSTATTSTSVIKSKEYNKILNNLTRNYQHGTSKPNNQSHTAAADILPVTQNQELNKMFTQSFRDLVSYYQPQQSDHHGDTSNSGNNPEDQIGIHEKKLKKKETNRKSSTPTTSTRKSRSPNPRNIELNLEEGQENKKEKLSKKQLKEKKNEKLVSSSSSTSLSSTSWQNKKDIIPSSSSSQSHLPLPLQGVEQVVITPSLENSKYLHGNTVSSGRIVYGIHNDGPIMSQEWNNTNNKPSHRLVQRSTIPSSSSSAPSSPIKKDPPPGATSGTTSAKRRSQSPDLSKKKKGMKGNNESDYPVKDDSIVPKRSSSARSSRKSSTTTSTSTSKFQHLTAPTFSSVIRSLNIAGIDYNDIQAITQASKDANYFVSSHHSDLSHPSYTDSYYTSGIDIITALATNGNQKKKMKQNKSKQK